MRRNVITKDDAARVAQEFLDRTYRRDGGHPAVVIAESATVEKPSGRLFVDNTAEEDPGRFRATGH